VGDHGREDVTEPLQLSMDPVTNTWFCLPWSDLEELCPWCRHGQCWSCPSLLAQSSLVGSSTFASPWHLDWPCHCWNLQFI